MSDFYSVIMIPQAAARLEKGLARVFGALSEVDCGSAPSATLGNSEKITDETERAVVLALDEKEPQDDQTISYSPAPTVTQNSSTQNSSADRTCKAAVSVEVSSDAAASAGATGVSTSKPDPLDLWRSSRAAAIAVQTVHSVLRHGSDGSGLMAAHTLLDLPEVLLHSRLLWTATVIRDKVFRGLMVTYIAKRLFERTKLAMASGADFRGDAPLPPLPHEDSHLRAAFQLCQYSFGQGNGYVFRALNEWIWRVFVPRLVCQVVEDCAHRQDEHAMEASSVRDTKYVDMVAGQTAHGPDASAVISANRGLLEEISLELQTMAR